MTCKRSSLPLIIVSLIAAVAILAVSAVFEANTAQTLTYLIIAVWWIPFSIIVARRAGKQPKGEI